MPPGPNPLWRARIAYGRRRRFRGDVRFDDRQRGAPEVVLVLAGFKDYLWDRTLTRVAQHAPADVDVCLLVAGVERPALRELAAARGWSYMETECGHVSVAQNLAIEHHPAARMIHKLDEDMFVGPGYFEAMSSGFRRVREIDEYRPGFVAPVINVNGFSYVEVLRLLGQEDAYQEGFGSLRRQAGQHAAQSDGAAAVFLWERSLPVDALAARFAAEPFGYKAVPHRFSIGAVLFPRETWESMGGFVAKAPAPGLGEDEEHIAVTCLRLSRPMLVLGDVFAGHFAFGPQERAMREAFGERLAEF